MNGSRSTSWQKQAKRLLVLGLLMLLVVLPVASVGAQEVKPPPEQVVKEYLQEKGQSEDLASVDFQVLMKDILWGVYPDLVAQAGEQEMTEYALKQLGLEPDTDKLEPLAPVALDKNGEPVVGKSDASTRSSSFAPDAVTAYNRNAVASYARTWAENGRQIRNSNYPNFTNDCTNFISQAVYAGGIPQEGSGICGSENTTSEWYVKRGVWPCSWAWSNPWSVVAPYRSYMTAEGRASAYLVSRTTTGINNLVYQGLSGDIIQLRRNGTSYHSMVVTSWYWNSTSDSDLRMTYHSGPNNNDVEEKSIRQIISGLPSGDEVIFVPMR